MSKFNVGDKVMLSPDSRWVEGGSKEPDSYNPLNMEGVIIDEDVNSERHKWGVRWSNDRTNTYSTNDLLPITGVSVRVETNLHDIIEEQEAHIENLEEALEMVTKELIELRGELSSPKFKPISEMSVHNWRQALEEGWEFEVRGIAWPVVVNELDFDRPTDYPVCLDNGHLWVTLQGCEWYHDSDRSTEDRDVIKRIK